LPKSVYFSSKFVYFSYSHNSSCLMHINPQFNHNLTYYHEYKVICKLTSHISTFHQSPSINLKVRLFSHLSSKTKLQALIVLYQSYMVHLSSSLQKTSHNIIISFKKNHHLIISSWGSSLIQSSSQIDKTISNSSKRYCCNFINQNNIKTPQKEHLGMSEKQPQRPGTHRTVCAILHNLA
jgi:hypothetical protein